MEPAAVGEAAMTVWEEGRRVEMGAMDSDGDGMGNSILPFKEDAKITNLPITKKIKKIWPHIFWYRSHLIGCCSN